MMFSVAEGQTVDEQRHGETNTSNHGQAHQIAQRHRCRPFGNTKFGRDQAEDRDANGFADDQTDDDAPRNSCLQSIGNDAAIHAHTSVGEREDRNDRVAGDGVQHGFQPLGY